MARAKIEKRCSKCGVKKMYRSRERRCKQRAFGVGSYCCWGDLVVVEKPPKPTKPPREKPRPQDVAARKHLEALGRVDEAIAEIKSATSKLTRWQKLATKYGRRAERLAAADASRQESRLAIALGGVQS